MKLPAFQFYPGDWRKDTGVQSLDYHSRGVWFEILCLMHESENRGVLTLNGSAMTDAALARLLGISEDLLKQNLTTLVNHGVTSRDPVNGALVCRRMVRDENLRKIRANSGKQGGNPVLLKQIPTTHLKQIPTPSSSSSSSDKKKAAPAFSLPFESELFTEAWANFEKHRFEIRKPLKPTSRKLALQELAAMGERRAIMAIRHTVAKGWQGIREPDIDERSRVAAPLEPKPADGPPGWREKLRTRYPDSQFDGAWSTLPDSVKTQL